MFTKGTILFTENIYLYAKFENGQKTYEYPRIDCLPKLLHNRIIDWVRYKRASWAKFSWFVN